MEQQVVIRTARRDDIDGVWPLVRDFSAAFKPERFAFGQSWARLVTAEETRVLVAETADGAIVGYLLARCHDTFLASGPVAWVEEVMVDARFRRHGIGHRLMQTSEAWARSVGAAYISLASRRAGAFYLAIGYEDSATFFKKAL